MVEPGRVIAISLSDCRGIPKSNVSEATLKTDWGLVGDAHAGPWHRQVSLLALESIDKIRALGLVEVQPGDFAENITTSGIDLLSLKIGHRYLLEWPGKGPESGNNLFLSSVRLKLNENWALRAVHHFEARDGTLEEQAYSVHRDFRSWTAALVARWRTERYGEDDFSLGVMVSLKAYPRYSLGSDRDYHQGLLD